MPKASAPNAPWVEVCESPHTIVMPGWVSPSCGPMTWTMPWLGEPMPWSGMPNSAQFRSSWLIWAAAWRSSIGRLRGVVGIEWSAVATVWAGRRTRQAALSKPGERLRRGHLVDEVEVHGEDGRRPRILGHDVVGPDLVDDGARAVGGHVARRPACGFRGR